MELKNIILATVAIFTFLSYFLMMFVNIGSKSKAKKELSTKKYLPMFLFFTMLLIYLSVMYMPYDDGGPLLVVIKVILTIVCLYFSYKLIKSSLAAVKEQVDGEVKADGELLAFRLLLDSDSDPIYHLKFRVDNKIKELDTSMGSYYELARDLGFEMPDENEEYTSALKKPVAVELSYYPEIKALDKVRMK